jgi:thiamine-monophosphate kinase
MAERVNDIGEFGLIRRIGSLLDTDGRRSARVSTGIGDDAASFLPRAGYELLITCDSMVEGRHYLTAFTTSFDIGRRAMTSNISDIGAMGGDALYALVSLGLPADTPVRDVEELYKGFLYELNPFGASIIGGNFTGSGNGMFIDITLIGEVEQGKAVRRSGAKPGDAVLVTGFPGRAAAGLQLLLRGPHDAGLADNPLVSAYTTPSHRARLGRAVSQTGYVTAMTDTSDGFLGDLGHVCEASGVGAEIVKEHLPLNEAVREAARVLGRDPYEFVLGESDDYELIITCDPDHVPLLQSVSGGCAAVPLTEVGTITAERGINMILPDGRKIPLGAEGFNHFRPFGGCP